MEIWDSAIPSNTAYPQQQRSPFIYLIAKYLSSFNLKSENAWTTGLNKVLYAHPKVCDSFPLPHIEEALQAVQPAIWFSSFDLVQGYLQMAMEEADIPKTAFCAGSSCLYEFTRMPFGLTNAGACFCHLMEMCIWGPTIRHLTILFGWYLHFRGNGRSNVVPYWVSICTS